MLCENMHCVDKFNGKCMYSALPLADAEALYTLTLSIVHAHVRENIQLQINV